MSTVEGVFLGSKKGVSKAGNEYNLVSLFVNGASVNVYVDRYYNFEPLKPVIIGFDLEIYKGVFRVVIKDIQLI